MARFGRSSTVQRSGGGTSTFYELDVNSQEEALGVLAQMTVDDTVKPIVRDTALAIVDDCPGHEEGEECELEALFAAVKDGTPKVKGLHKGLKYMSDPIHRDFYTSPARLLQDCANGPCAEDCDGHAMLMAALAGSIGYSVGLRAWGPKGSKNYVHIYAVVLLPKDGGGKRTVYGLDTSADVGEATPGWEPPEGRVITAWLNDGEG
jgi:hypothetical protein